MKRGIVWLLFAFCAIPAVATDNLVFHLGPLVGLENATIDYGLFRITPSFGAATFDVNQDGWPDLVISNHGLAPLVFLNQKGKSFREAPGILPLPNADRHSPAVADYDNDGDEDIYWLKGAHDGFGLGPKEFLVNPGHGKPFVLVPHPELEDPKGRGRTGVWFDYDNDGFLDLLAPYKIRSDAPNRLYHNNGDGTFTDVSAASGLMLSINSEGGAVASDFDNDGDMDVLFCNTDDRPYLMMNQGNGTFRDETFRRGIPAISNTWAAGVADYNDDGAPDIYFSRGNDAAIAEGAVIAEHRINYLQEVDPGDHVDKLTFHAGPRAVLHFMFSSHRVDRDHLYVGAAGTKPDKLDFKTGPGFLSAEGIPQQWREDGSARGTFIWHDSASGIWTVAAAAGSTDLITGALIETGATLSGLDLSGMEPFSPKFPDVLLQNDGRGNFRTQTAQAQLNNASNSRSPLWVDLDNDGDLDLFIVNAGFNGSGKQPHVCFINDNGKFTGYALHQGPYERFGRGDGGIVADFNKDGLMDLFVLNGSGLLPANRGPYQLFLNRTKTQNRWITFRLTGAGKDYTNRDSVGAKIQLKAGDKTYWRFINGGGSDCLSTRSLQFGLGMADSAGIVVYWPPSKTFPQGHTQSYTFDVSHLNHRYNIDERGGIK